MAALCCTVLTAAPALAATASADPLARLRSQVETARQRSVPPPGTSAIDLAWVQLFPPYWKPGRTLDRLGVAKLEDEDPRAGAIMAQIRKEWEDAPTVKFAAGTVVRLTGFPVMPAEGAGPVTQIILAPYYGACVHTPAPPANQMVLVALGNELPRTMYQYPVWVTGKISVKPTDTRHGRVAYQMTDARWEPYPYQKYPMPQYHFPR